jgi:hypothetical protein
MRAPFLVHVSAAEPGKTKARRRGQTRVRSGTVVHASHAADASHAVVHAMNVVAAHVVSFLMRRLEVDDDIDEDDEDEDADVTDDDDDDEDEDDFDDEGEEPETWQVLARQWTGRSTPNRVSPRANPLRHV